MSQFHKDIQENALVVATLNRKILKDVLEKINLLYLGIIEHQEKSSEKENKSKRRTLVILQASDS